MPTNPSDDHGEGGQQVTVHLAWGRYLGFKWKDQDGEHFRPFTDTERAEWFAAQASPFGGEGHAEVSV